jgi:hypothetical protein
LREVSASAGIDTSGIQLMGKSIDLDSLPWLTAIDRAGDFPGVEIACRADGKYLLHPMLIYQFDQTMTYPDE